MLSKFFQEALDISERLPQHIACPKITGMLKAILLHPSVSKEIPRNIDPQRATLYEKEGGFTILGHHHPKSVSSQPHDHGRTWAIYGVVTGRTAMYQYTLVEPPKNENKGKVKLTKSYWVFPGQAFWFPTGAIHSHKTYDDSMLIRLEGMNIWQKNNKIGGQTYEMIT